MFEDVRSRLRERLQASNIDAYLAYTPANIYYTIGFFSPLVNLSWRLMGTDMALIPADPTLAPALITSDFVAGPAKAATGLDDIRTYRMWVENRDIDVIAGPPRAESQISRPAQFDKAEIHRRLREALGERGLSSATIGTDLQYMYHDSLEWLQRTNPECRFADMTGALYEMRAIKYPQEIELHRNAARLFEAGINRAVADAREGHSARDIHYLYQAGALDAARADPNLGELQGAFGFTSVGAGARASFGGTSGLANGDLVKFDCGVTVGGYYSDCGRTFVFGKASDEQRRVYEALQSAHAVARDMMRPGVVISEVFRAAAAEVAAQGFPNYSRGHFGHSIGLDTFVEEPPFVSADEHAELQPGMVLCLETPYYSASLGSYQIEDMVLITENGCEFFNTLPYDLVEL